MSPNQLSMFIPSRRTLVVVAVSGVLGGVLALLASARLATADKPAPNPAYSHDRRFVAIGRAYLPQLGKAYAAAWEQGAKKLEAGGGIAVSLDAVSQSWKSNRVQLYDRMLTPEFAKIVAENIKDEDLTTAERTAMAAAWRGLSLGLGN